MNNNFGPVFAPPMKRRFGLHRARLRILLMACLPIFIGCGFDVGQSIPGAKNIVWSRFVILPAQGDYDTSRGGYVILADFDFDGDLDAVSGFASDDAITFHFHEGTRTWINRLIAEGAGPINSLAAADLAKSDYPDLVAATGTGNVVFLVAPRSFRPDELWEGSVLRNPRPVGEWNDVKIVQLDDLAGPEIVAVSATDNIVGLWYTSGRPMSGNEYQPFVIAQLFGRFERLAVADIDKDGDSDLVVAGPGGGVIWLENRGPRNRFEIWPAHTITTRRGLTRLVVEDIDQDGELDVVCTDPSTGRVFWYESLSNPRIDPFVEHVVADLTPARPDALAVADVDEDDELDLIVGTEGPVGTVVWMEPLGDPRRPWRVLQIDATGFEVGELPVGNIDSQGRLDFATTLAGSDTPVVWYEQN